MHFSKTLTILSSLAVTALGTTISYDREYDDANASLNSVACSDGSNGLVTRFGWQTQGQVKGFPHIGGVEAVDRWNSPNCGSCWQATYNGRSIYILAIDHASRGLNIAFSALNELTGGNAEQFGRIEADVKQVTTNNCGL